MPIILEDEAATEAFGFALAPLLHAGDAILLSGDLGAGKTTLSRGVLRGLGFEGEAASPTFPIVIAYDPPATRLPIWHVDLYRIDDPHELAELALGDALIDSALLIEWPERLGRLAPPGALRIEIAANGVGRALTVQVPEAWEARWPPR